MSGNNSRGNRLRLSFISVAIALLVTTGCATRGAQYVPLVDMRDKSQNEFNSDLQDCQAYARQRMTAGEGAVAGAVGGALLGALLGAMIAPKGYRNDGARAGARGGAVGGGLGLAASANETQESIIKRCLAGRGYNVLN